jgi:hypothetical protein
MRPNPRYKAMLHMEDWTLEMWDVIRDVIFFERALYPPVDPHSLKVGSTIVVWRRPMKVLGYFDSFTQETVRARPGRLSALSVFYS